MAAALYAISLFSALALLGLGMVSKFSGKFQFWPPPAKRSWQDISFMLLFRFMLYPLIAVSYLEFELSETLSPIIQLGVGGALLIFGFGLAIASTLNLGWKNAFGDKKGLVTDGWFRCSRNPVYVVTIFGLTGWFLLTMSIKIGIVLSLWALLYLVAIPLEEEWLEEVYGDEYRDYKSSVPRFL